MKHLRRFNESLSLGKDLEDILLEINDYTFWRAECWYEYKWIVVIEPIFLTSNGSMWSRLGSEEDGELDGQNPPTFVIETIKRSIDFMNSEGFINYKIMFGSNSSTSVSYIILDDLSSSEIWPDEFIRIEFMK